MNWFFEKVPVSLKSELRDGILFKAYLGTAENATQMFLRGTVLTPYIAAKLHTPKITNSARFPEAVCLNVKIEPGLQSLEGKSFHNNTNSIFARTGGAATGFIEAIHVTSLHDVIHSY